MGFRFVDTQAAQPAPARGFRFVDESPSPAMTDYPLSSYSGGELKPEERMKAMNPDYKPIASPKLVKALGPTGYAAYKTTVEEGLPLIVGMAGVPLAGGNPGGFAVGYAAGKGAARTINALAGESEPETAGQALSNTLKDLTEAGIGQGVFDKGIKAAKGVAKYVAETAPQKLYASATKMSTTLEPKDRAARVATGLREGIGVNDKGLAKLDSIKNEVLRAVDDVLAPGAKEGATISTDAILSRLNKVRGKFSESATPNEYLSAIDRIAEDFKSHGAEIPVLKAQRIKQNIYQILKDSAYGELKGPQKEAQKAIARGIKEELEGLYPELKGLNQKASEYIRLQDSLERAVGRIQNRDIVSLGDEVMTTAGATIGGPAGAGAVVARKILGLPQVKARLAIAMHRAGKGAKKALSYKLTESGALPWFSSKDRLVKGKAEAILNSKIPDADKERFLVQEVLKQDGFKALPPGEIKQIFGPEGSWIINRTAKVIRKPQVETRYFKKVEDGYIMYDPAKENYYALPENLKSLNQVREVDILDLADKATHIKAEPVSKTSELLDLAQKSQQPKTFWDYTKKTMKDEKGSVGNLSEPKWHTFGQEKRKDFFNPEKIRESGNYQVWDFDENKFWTFRDKAAEKIFRDKYPFALLSENPVGPEKIYYRYGKPPATNRSINYQDNKAEPGVSAYTTPEGNNPFFAGREVYFGKGRQVGWGSDGEPVIIPTEEWKKYK